MENSLPKYITLTEDNIDKEGAGFIYRGNGLTLAIRN